MYSQNDEERVILDFFRGRPPGVLLDLGAYDGSTFSNSRALIEAGWSAVVIEPSPWPFGALVDLHKDHPQVELVNALILAAGPAGGGLSEFFVTRDATSCTQAGTTQRWGADQYRRILVPAVSVDQLHHFLSRETPRRFDFISVDVEDDTMPLVRALGATDWLAGVALICLEHTAGGISSETEMTAYMAAQGRRVIHRTPENLLFA